MKNNYYVYQYNRQDGTPYYIGKGKGKRAWSRLRRVQPPSDPLRIIIVVENCTEEEAFQIEQYLIAYYGRIDKGTGILRNMTDGGEGGSGTVKSMETRQKVSQALRDAKRARAILQFDLKGNYIAEYYSVGTAQNELNASIYKCLTGVCKTCAGYIWVYKDEYENEMNKNIVLEKYIPEKYKPVLQYTLEGEFVAEYPTMTEAGKSINRHGAQVSACARGLIKHAGGYVWRYKN